MEKYSQFRDRGSGIAPFFPIPTQPSGLALPFHVFLFILRLPLLISALLIYAVAVSWLPAGSPAKKLVLWSVIGILGIWWIDLQVDGVKRGSLSNQPPSRLPGPGSVIASSFTSPLDCLYLATIFDPIFTVSWPNSRKVQRISLFQAMLRALAWPQSSPPSGSNLTDLATLLEKNPEACIVVFPECTTTNGRGILPFGPALLSAPAKTKIFPLNLRYTPGDVVTPVPGTYIQFLWNLCSKPTHCIRTRIAECAYNTAQSKTNGLNLSSTSDSDGNDDGLNSDERKLLDRIGEDLARLGRVKRVAIGVKEKDEFSKTWTRKRK